jgi:ferredoxin
MNYRPYPKNVPGSFYVVDGCCIACAIPQGEAPDHFAFDQDGHCYIKKQPCTQTEIDRMLQAMWSAELDCIRYCGRDSNVFQRLGAMGKPHLCDFPPAEGIAIVLRNHVAFVKVDGGPAVLEEAVEDFRSFWMKTERRTMRGPRRPLLGGRMWFELAWYKNRYHRIHVQRIGKGKSRILVSHAPKEPSRGISSILSSWLTQSKRYGQQQWYTA